MKAGVFLACFLLAAGGLAVANPSTATPVVVNYGTFPVTVGGASYDLITIVQDFPPGTGIPMHRHGGYLVVTVVSGELTLHDKGIDRVIKTGESFTESPGNLHYVTNDGSSQVRIAVSVLLPKGAEITTMAPN